MVRERLKRQRGKFFLKKKSRFEPTYYQASGVQDVGTENETPFIYFTRYIDYAQGFLTVKAARAMADKLGAEYGVETVIYRREGR